MSKKKIKIVCEVCGSENVKRDAQATWCEETQQWVLCNVLDNANCESDECDGAEVELKEVKIKT